MSEPADSHDALELFMTEIRVFDWPGTVRWYVETLGLRLLVHDEPNGFALLAAGRGRLALEEGRRRRARRSTTPGSSSGSPTSTPSATGCSPRASPSTEPVENDRESYREVRLTTPKGRRITLFTWTDRRTVTRGPRRSCFPIVQPRS